MVRGVRAGQAARCARRWCARRWCALARCAALRCVALGLPCAHPRKGAGVVGKGAGMPGATTFLRCASLLRGARVVGACAVPCAPLRVVSARSWVVVVDGAPLRVIRCRCRFASHSWHVKPWPPLPRASAPFRARWACPCTLTPARTALPLARCVLSVVTVLGRCFSSPTTPAPVINSYAVTRATLWRF